MHHVLLSVDEELKIGPGGLKRWRFLCVWYYLKQTEYLNPPTPTTFGDSVGPPRLTGVGGPTELVGRPRVRSHRVSTG